MTFGLRVKMIYISHLWIRLLRWVDEFHWLHSNGKGEYTNVLYGGFEIRSVTSLNDHACRKWSSVFNLDIFIFDNLEISISFEIFNTKPKWSGYWHEFFFDDTYNLMSSLIYFSVIVHLASEAIFSERLNELQKEIKPLYKISSCTYKRTSVQTIFEKAGFKIDWCAFKIITKADHLPSKPHTSQHNSLANQKKHWESIARSEVPQRNYVDELAFAIAIPGMLFALLVALVTVILCFQHEKL